MDIQRFSTVPYNRVRRTVPYSRTVLMLSLDNRIRYSFNVHILAVPIPRPLPLVWISRPQEYRYRGYLDVDSINSETPV